MPDIALLMLDWYDRHRRQLPWRAPPGACFDPYRVWVSEIMLQQTGVTTVIPYYERFMQKWPDVRALASADLHDVLRLWAGLGYYARARNLHACASEIVRHHHVFPDNEADLRKLPGIGPYTAAAITAMAFQKKAVVVDGNVERIMARLHAVTTPLPAAKPHLKELATRLTPSLRPGDYAQSLMDLGAMICRPRRPGCEACPLAAMCAARRRGLATALPRREAKPKRPVRYARIYWLQCGDRVLMRRRPPSGLLGGMLEFPSSPWRDVETDDHRHAPVTLDWQPVDGTVRHVFSHFEMNLTLFRAQTEGPESLVKDKWHGANSGTIDSKILWVRMRQLEDESLPEIMRKVASLCRA